MGPSWKTSHLSPVECNHWSLYVKHMWLWVDDTDRQVSQLTFLAQSRQKDKKANMLRSLWRCHGHWRKDRREASSSTSQEEQQCGLREEEDEMPHEFRCFPSQIDLASSNRSGGGPLPGESLKSQHREKHAHWLPMALYGWPQFRAVTAIRDECTDPFVHGVLKRKSQLACY